jgi:hypothetical protein
MTLAMAQKSVGVDQVSKPFGFDQGAHRREDSKNLTFYLENRNNNANYSHYDVLP